MTTTDPRGVLRGRCTTCECAQYILQPGGAVKCSQCGHPPGKHINVSASGSPSQPAAPSYAGAVRNCQVSQTHDHHSSSVSAASTSSSAYGSGYVGHSAPPPPPSDLPPCPAPGCHSKVHYDHELGPFDYCSPECRDRHLLPIEHRKLKEDIKTFSKKIADLPPLDPVKAPEYRGKDRKVTVGKRPKEDLGLVIRKDRVEDGLLVIGVKFRSPAYESVKKGDVEFLDVITEVNGEPCIMESEYQESVHPKTRPELTLKRSGAMPSIKKLLSEVEDKHFLATHIMVLQKPQRIGGEYDFGFKPVFIKDQGVMLALNDTHRSSAYQSRVTNDDIIMMYAIVDNTKISTFKRPSKKRSEGEETKDFENDISKAAQDGNSIILVLKRLPPRD